MNETSKCYEMRFERGHFHRYLRGRGLDVSGSDDILTVPDGLVRSWRAEDGDAQFLASIPDNEFDFVYSAHYLEHLYSVSLALKNWARVLKPGGYLYLVVPDYILYEKMLWPSQYNPQHLYSFSTTITRDQVNRQNHYHIDQDLIPILRSLGVQVVEAYVEADGFDFNNGMADQTLGSALAQILVVGKRVTHSQAAGEAIGFRPSTSRPIDWSTMPQGGRYEMLQYAMRRLAEVHPGPARVVETGTLRNEDSAGRSGDGWSTLAWGWFCAQTGGVLYTIDVDACALEVSRRITQPYSEYIRYICQDSVSLLQSWGALGLGSIHMLYLDSLDYHDREKSEAHHLAEAAAALPMLAPKSLVLIDDTWPLGDQDSSGGDGFEGKGARAIPLLLQYGFRLERCSDRQVLLVRD